MSSLFISVAAIRGTRATGPNASDFCPEGPLQKEIASRAGRDFCSLVFKAQGFLIEQLLEGFLVLRAWTLFHGAAPFR